MGEFSYKTKGINAPRTLNKITRAGVSVKGCKRQDKSLFFSVSKKGCIGVEKSLGESVLEFERREKKGFFELFSFRRLGVIFGVVLCLFLVLFFSNFFLKIEVVGLNFVELKKVENFLQNHGVTVGKLKKEIDLGEMEKHLKKEFAFSVASVTFKGVTLVINVKEELSPSYYFDQTKKQSLYASENAVVTRIVKIDGTQVVDVGKSVKAGDVLIKNEKTVGESVFEIRAIGEIYGRVWREYEVFIPETCFSYQDTGVKNIVYGVGISRSPKEQESPFTHSRREVLITHLGGFLPIYHYKTIFYEQKGVEKTNPDFLDQTEILKRLKSEAEIKLQKEDGEFIRSWHSVRDVDGGKIVKLTVEIEKRIDEYR